MKRKLIFLIALVCMLLIGCGKNGEKDIVKSLSKKIEKNNSYYLQGELEIINNEDSYHYDVEVAHKKDDNYKVSLKNKTNNHEQIILRNEDGVYVLTPSLNKSFKFQSEWPYNNSQSYLLQSILKDIKSDNDRKFTEKDGNYIITTSVNYSGNKNLVKQNIYIDKDLNVKEVHVLNNENQVQMKMKFTKTDFDHTFNDNYFALKNNMETTTSTVATSNSIDKIIYPMYLPANTHLSDQKKIMLDDGERLILTFAGDNPFMLIQETAQAEEEYTTISMHGEPYLLLDTVAALSDSSITWISNGIEYYVASNVLDSEELLNVAASISVMPVGK